MIWIIATQILLMRCIDCQTIWSHSLRVENYGTPRNLKSLTLFKRLKPMGPLLQLREQGLHKGFLEQILCGSKAE
jgi:hypothetical protein